LESLKGRDFSEDLGIGRRRMLKWIFGKLGFGGMDLIRLAQDRDWWQPVVNMVMNLQFP
jgi:hypothetical protein